MKYDLILYFICLLLFISCSEKITGSKQPFGESCPEGPLKICYSKVKSETEYQLGTDYLLKHTTYKYYSNGLLKYIKRVYDEGNGNETERYYYDSDNLILKTVSGFTYTDTTRYHYNTAGQLYLETISFGNPIYTNKDSTKYKYNDSGLLIETLNIFHIDSSLRRYTFEYEDSLLVKKTWSCNNTVYDISEYEYFNNILTKINTYRNNIASSQFIYYYEDGLLKTIARFVSCDNTKAPDGRTHFYYNAQNELIQKIVHPPSISSYVAHEVYYEYY